MASTAKKEYIRGYEVKGVTPLPHYFEEIYGHAIGIPKLGIRGDAHYFWYSKHGNGAAYYEMGEEKKSADSTLQFFNDPLKRRDYFDDIETILGEVKAWIDKVMVMDLKQLSLSDLSDLFESGTLLEANVFSYYIVSQPYRLQGLEDLVRLELKKRVAGSRIDFYLARLVAYPGLSKTAEEELDRAKLIVSMYDEKPATAENITPKLRASILKHYERYKVLSLGDGQWEYDPEGYIEQFVKEFEKPESYYQERIKAIEGQPALIAQEKDKLIAELDIDKTTRETIEFLSEMSHVRFSIRVEGFVPLIYYLYNIVTAELADRYGYHEEGDMLWQSETELSDMLAKQTPVIPVDEIRRRRGKDDAYLIKLDEGKVTYLYGQEADAMFAELVPVVDHKNIEEVQGVTAEPGQVRGRATVYQWGDDMDEALKTIEANPILVAGQTRPAMMQIIRKAQGIITDEGGVTSHAAIVARELGIPTVINTHVGTKVFKTGDELYLDADDGIARRV